MKEEIVVILDANPSMGEEIYANDETSRLEDTETTLDDFLGTTKFDVARYMVQELFLHAATTTTGTTLPEDPTIRVLALITLGGRLTEGIPNPPTPDNFIGRKRNRSSSALEDPLASMDTTGGSSGCRCYCSDEGDSESSMDGLQSLLRSLHVSPASSLRCQTTPADGDFVTGMVRATEVLVRHTTVGADQRRIVLVTDARHKVLVPNIGAHDEDPMEALVHAINRLRAMGCTLEVVGMGFSKQTPSSSHSTSENTGMPPTKEAMDDKSTAQVESESESEDESDGDSSDSEASQEDWSDVQDQNEILVMDLVEKLGGCVRAIGGKPSSREDWCGMRTVPKIPLTRNSQTPKGPSKLIQGDNHKTVDHRREVGAIAIAPNRDSSSLRPHPGTRILYWNGTDDVLLPEWIKIAKPSCWSGTIDATLGGLPEAFCFWIQIDDPLRPKDDSFKVRETKNRCSPGNWLVGCDLDSVDLLWEKIAIATAYGRLGPSSRVSPTKHLVQRMLASKENPATGNGCCVIGMIYVGIQNSKDRAEIQRILDVLCKDLEIPSCYLRFQPDPGAKGGHPRLYTARHGSSD